MTLPAPHCECGSIECASSMRHEESNLLPDAAWAVAGSGGINRGPNGEDLAAILPAHFDPAAHDLVDAHEGWLAIIDRREVNL